jgi:hypothetical protein
MMEPHTLVFSGGANHVAAFLGGLKYLEVQQTRQQSRQAHLHPRRVVGSSAGALLALMVSLGMRSDEMVAWTLELAEKHAFTQIDLDGALSLHETYGLDRGQRLASAIRATINRFLPACGCLATFKDVAQAKGIDLVVCALNVSSQRFEYLSVETAACLPVATAVQMSMSLPFLFAPVPWRGALYVDPVLGRNFPWDFPGAPRHGQDFPGAPRHAQLDQGVLGFLLVESSSTKGGAGGGLGAYAMNVMNVAFYRANECPPDAPGFPVVRVCVGDVPKFSLGDLSFKWDAECVARLVDVGYEQTREHFSSRNTHAHPDPQELLHHEDQQHAGNDVHEHV